MRDFLLLKPFYQLTLGDQAEKSGLGGDELAALQEEFQHHQAKVDEYHALLELAGEDDHKRFNDIRRELDKEVFDIRDTNEYHRSELTN